MTKGIFRNILRISFIILGFLALIFVLDTLLGKGEITGNFMATLGESVTKLECKQQSYETTEYYEEQVPYEEVEYYTQTESGKNCDYISGCTCIHKSWLGLGACDSCECEKSRTITKYKIETKSRTITKLTDVCIKLKKWQSPNYNENWLNYPEIYNSQGERITITN